MITKLLYFLSEIFCFMVTEIKFPITKTKNEIIDKNSFINEQ